MTDATPRNRFDIAIIGAGSGGMAAARRARAHGLSVALFDPNAVGGTCVNAGCVPKKLLVHASRLRDGFDNAPRSGWHTDPSAFDWPTLRDAVLREVGRLSDLHRTRLRSLGVTVIPERAMIELPGIVRTDSGRRVEASDIVIATGAAPLVPKLPGAAGALVSDDLFHLPALPKSLAIVGGGYIAVEFACLLHRFGVAVTLFEAGDRLIGQFDDEVAAHLDAAMRAQGIDIRLHTRIASIDAAASEAVLTLGDGSSERFGEVMLAVGRRPNTSGLGLAELGVARTSNGAVTVDACGQSSISGIHAIGDATDTMMLTPVAVRDGRRCIDAILGHKPDPSDDIVPTATFTTPECGMVGLTESQARAKGLNVEIRRKSFSTLAAALSNASQDIFMKAVVGRTDGRLLGMHFFGPHAGEAAQMGAIALSAGLTEGELGRTMSLHPSTAEEVIGLGDPDMPIHGQMAAPKPLAAE